MHLTADNSVSDEFQNVNTFILDWKLVYRCKIKTNEVKLVLSTSVIKILLCISAWWEVLTS